MKTQHKNTIFTPNKNSTRKNTVRNRIRVISFEASDNAIITLEQTPKQFQDYINTGRLETSTGYYPIDIFEEYIIEKQFLTFIREHFGEDYCPYSAQEFYTYFAIKNEFWVSEFVNNERPNKQVSRSIMPFGIFIILTYAAKITCLITALWALKKYI